MSAFTVADGRILRDGELFTPMGVTYQAPAVGCRIWSDWRPADLRDDFRRISDAGFNTVRFFLYWRDVQPGPGEISSTVIGRLREAVSTADEAGLACVVSLFTIWMNGQLLDLPWRRGRDIWRDPELVGAEELLARHVASALREYGNVLAFDLGDEVWNVDRAAADCLTHEEVAAWQDRLTGVLRKETPGVLVMQANDASAVFAPGPFGPDNSAGLDIIGTHGFPSWAPGAIESTLSFKATHLVPFLVKAAGAHGVPLVDELASYGTDETTNAAYLRATVASALGNGASGVLVWCWQDITSRHEPYRERPMERLTGLHRADGTPRPALHAVRKALAARLGPAAPTTPAPTAVYLPEHVRSTGSSYLDAPGSMVASFYAYLLLKRAHLDFDLVTGETTGRRLVICPSPTRLTLDDIERLARSARAGATVFLSLGDHLHGFAGADLVGAEIVDFDRYPDGKSALLWEDTRWPLSWETVRTVPTTLRALDAEVLARYPDGSPALVTKALGKGRVVFTNAPFEAQIDGYGRLTTADWPELYLRLARLAGVGLAVECSDPDVEVLPRPGERVLVVNHSARPARVELVRGTARRTVQLPEKDWAIVDFRRQEGIE
ncbi:cellulase family glycosylhydrolase [Streptomyces europaeiscabiei]|uniref:cellulase family glycosylhydrolase n=1 Tax=Streptomyces europaeiscabiei TaxID=146819 RepID=UPI0029B471AC|nr:cellulase family glycosylhydrolase [Streptomyces europaeiscabiei]MDX2525297.1 cellulase family glycosylhydrolase [Streptomyces europaeiscabiei]